MEERLTRILLLLSEGGEALPGPTRLCQVAAEVTAMDGAGLVLLSDGRFLGVLCGGDVVSETLAELEFALGEGPCLDAWALDGPVFEPDLASPFPYGRWPAFAPAGTDAGARAVFGFPVHVGAARLGAIGLYRDQTGPLGDEQHADALVMADVVARAILSLQAGAALGTVGAELATGANFQAVVHQASGMVSVQVGEGVGDALVRLRAHAYGTDCTITEVATEVVARRLRFDRLEGEETGGGVPLPGVR